MGEKLDQVTDALEAAFKARVTEMSGTAFEQTGVTLPARSIWQAYAQAAVKAMHDPTDAMVRAVGSEWGPALEDHYRAMIDAA